MSGSHEDLSRGVVLHTRGVRVPSISWRKLSEDLHRWLLENGKTSQDAIRLTGTSRASITRVLLADAGAASVSSTSFMAICELIRANPYKYFIGMNPQPSDPTNGQAR